LNLPAGSFQFRLYEPTTGPYSPAPTVEGGKSVTVQLPSFRQDVALRATRSP
jgi:hypothetical protein